MAEFSLIPNVTSSFLFYGRELQNKVDMNLCPAIRVPKSYGKTFIIFIAGRSYSISNLQRLAVVIHQLRGDQVLLKQKSAIDNSDSTQAPLKSRSVEQSHNKICNCCYHLPTISLTTKVSAMHYNIAKNRNRSRRIWVKSPASWYTSDIFWIAKNRRKGLLKQPWLLKSSELDRN